MTIRKYNKMQEKQNKTKKKLLRSFFFFKDVHSADFVAASLSF